ESGPGIHPSSRPPGNGTSPRNVSGRWERRCRVDYKKARAGRRPMTPSLYPADRGLSMAAAPGQGRGIAEIPASGPIHRMLFEYFVAFYTFLLAPYRLSCGAAEPPAAWSFRFASSLADPPSPPCGTIQLIGPRPQRTGKTDRT